MGDLYALDFDGVLCDNCGETAISAVKAAKLRWPELFTTVDSSTEDWIVDQMQTVWPVVETGYETLLLVRLLLEIKIPLLQRSSVTKGLTVEGILETWSANRFYPGFPDALRFASSQLYIVTTKQGRFADALLRELAGVTIPPERIYALGSGPKVEVLKMLQKQPEHQGLTLHFVEDRLATLKNVIKEPELTGWNLYLVDWGYNTQKEREEAATYSRIHLLQLSDFTQKLK
ncbi:hypothetical protein L1987_58988 [Smallanthus sonchifolius]|uniref:Uncharacterized protein n=1 Tax=Smallanthus sonchifolius TaxID=185202 RepID=A0ACB9D482_9ASTR|nr:hypothetical protein L1987_58988 [Smallanthus sonchifolius]